MRPVFTSPYPRGHFSLPLLGDIRLSLSLISRGKDFCLQKARVRLEYAIQQGVYTILMELAKISGNLTLSWRTSLDLLRRGKRGKDFCDRITQ